MTSKRFEMLEQLVILADQLRKCQREYLADRGNEEKGKRVGVAAKAYDELRMLLDKEEEL